MKRIHKLTKLYIMDMAPIEAIDLINKFQIPTPYKELLNIICIRRIKGFKILDILEEEYNIKLPYYTMIQYFDVALEMFYKSNQYFIKKQSKTNKYL